MENWPKTLVEQVGVAEIFSIDVVDKVEKFEALRALERCFSVSMSQSSQGAFTFARRIQTFDKLAHERDVMN